VIYWQDRQDNIGLHVIVYESRSDCMSVLLT